MSSEGKYLFPILLLILAAFSPGIIIGEPGMALHQTIETQATGFTGYIIPTVIVADYFLYENLGSNSTATEEYAEKIITTTNEYFFNSSIPVHYNLTKVEIFSDEATNNATFDYQYSGNGYEIGPLLSSVKTYADAIYPNQVEVQLLSGIELVDSGYIGAVGLAYIGNGTPDGGTWARSVVQATFIDDDQFTALISAHEIGHNYGALHDGTGSNTCANTGYIMSTSASNPSTPLNFSQCSINEINYFLDTYMNSTEYVDNLIPTITYLNTTEIYRGIDRTRSIVWEVDDGADDMGYYSIIVNGTTIIDLAFFDDGVIWYGIDVDKETTYSIELLVYDVVGHQTSQNFDLKVVDVFPEFRVSPGDQSLFENESLILTWELWDNGNSSQVDVFLNETIVETFNFSQSTLYEFTIENLNIGTYELKIEVFDELRQTTSDIVYIDVLALPTEDGDTTGSEDQNIIQSFRGMIALPFWSSVLALLLLRVFYRRYFSS